MDPEAPAPPSEAISLYVAVVQHAPNPTEALAMFDAIPEVTQAAEVLLCLPESQGMDLFLSSKREGLQNAVLTGATSERRVAFFIALEPGRRVQAMMSLPADVKLRLMPFLGGRPRTSAVPPVPGPAKGLNENHEGPSTPPRNRLFDAQAAARQNLSAIRNSFNDAEAGKGRAESQGALSPPPPEREGAPERPPTTTTTPIPTPKPKAVTPKKPAQPQPKAQPAAGKSHKEIAESWDRTSKRKAKLKLQDDGKRKVAIEEVDDVDVVREDNEWEDELDDDPDTNRELFEQLPIESQEEFEEGEKNWKPTSEQPHRPFTWRWADRKMGAIPEHKLEDPMGAWGYAQDWQYALQIRKFGMDGFLKMCEDLETKFEALPAEYKEAVGPPRGRGDCKMDYHARLFWAIHMPTYHNIESATAKGEFADRTLALFYENFPDYSPFCARRRIDLLGQEAMSNYKKKMKGYQTSAISHSATLGGKYGGLLRTAVNRDAGNWLLDKLRKTSKEHHWGKSEEGEKIVGPLYEAALDEWVAAHPGENTKGISLGLLHHLRAREFKKQPDSVQKRYEAIARTVPEYDPDNLAAVNDTALMVIDGVLHSVAAKTQWRSLFLAVAETTAGPKYLIGEYGPDGDKSPSFVYHDEDGKNLISAFKDHAARILRKDAGEWENTRLNDVGRVADGPKGFNLQTRGKYRDTSYPPPVFPVKATDTQRRRILSSWLLKGIEKISGVDAEWKPIGRNNTQYFDVLTIPPDQNGRPGPMTITELSWMSPENVNKLIEHIHASAYDKDMDEDRRFTFVGQRVHEEPPDIDTTAASGKPTAGSKSKKVVAKPKPVAKAKAQTAPPSKKSTSKKPSRSTTVSSRKLRSMPGRGQAKNPKPDQTPEPEDGDESGEDGSAFAPAEGDEMDVDELDDGDVEGAAAELEDLEGAEGDSQDGSATASANGDGDEEMSEAGSEKEGEESVKEEQKESGDDDAGGEEEDQEMLNAAVVVGPLAPFVPSKLSTFPRMRTFRLVHPDLKMGGKAKPWNEDFDRAVFLDQARSFVIQVNQDNATIPASFSDTHTVPLPKLLCAATIIKYLHEAVGIPIALPDGQRPEPPEPATCDPLRWEPADFLPEPYRGIVKGTIELILNPARSVPLAGDVLSHALDFNLPMFKALHNSILRALGKLVLMLRDTDYMEYPVLDLVGTARATLYLQRSGAVLDVREPSAEGSFASAGAIMAGNLSDIMATICILRYISGVMIPVVFKYRHTRNQDPVLLKMWELVHLFVDYSAWGMQGLAAVRLANMFTARAFSDHPTLKLVAEGLLHDAPYWDVEFPSAPAPFVLQTRVDLMNAGLPEFLDGTTPESWGVMSIVDRALLLEMVCFAAIQIDQGATRKSGETQQAARLSGALIRKTNMFDSHGDNPRISMHLPPDGVPHELLPFIHPDTVPFVNWETGAKLPTRQPEENNEKADVDEGRDEDATHQDTAAGGGEADAGPSVIGGGSVAPQLGATPESARVLPARSQSVLGRRTRAFGLLGDDEHDEQRPATKRRADSTPPQSIWGARNLRGRSFLSPVPEEWLPASQRAPGGPNVQLLPAASTTITSNAAVSPIPPSAHQNPATSTGVGAALGDAPVAPLEAPGNVGLTPNSARRRSSREKVKPSDPVPRTLAERRDGQQG